MEDSTLFTVGIFASTILLGPAIVLVLYVVGRVAARGGGAPGPGLRLGCGLLVLLPVCGFCGLMVATAGGAIHPPLVTVAAPYVCDGTVELQSQGYSYKPGQRGVARTISCLGPDGRKRDITLRAIGAATVYYTLIFLPVWLLIGIAARRWLRGRITDMSARAGSKDIADLRATMAERLRTGADSVRRPATASGTGGESVGDRLRRLQALYDEGLITDAEYRARRAAIVSSL